MSSGIDITKAPIIPIKRPTISIPFGIYLVLIDSRTVNIIGFKLIRETAGPIGPEEQARPLKVKLATLRMLPRVPSNKILTLNSGSNTVGRKIIEKQNASIV